MKQALYPTDAAIAVSGALRGQKSKRRSIFASLIAALQHSRRLQARRVLRQYRHLIAAHPSSEIQNLNLKNGGLQNARE
jgi:hypothetical protein